MKKDKKLSLDEHLEVADDLSIAFYHLCKALDKCQNHYPKSHRLMKTFMRVHPVNMKSSLCSLKIQLDEEYRKTISDTEFDEIGDIYYSLEDRYKKLKGKI